MNFFYPADHLKWRLTYKGGTDFINSYLEKVSSRETDELFTVRRKMTYCPAVAKAELNKIRDNIASQLPLVKREGSEKYLKFISKNVDRYRHSMDMFIVKYLLPELLPMGQVGVYMDMHDLRGKTLNETYSKTPYLYLCEIESIAEIRRDEEGNVTYLHLKDDTFSYFYEIDGFLSYRKMKGEEIITAKELDLPYVPFTMVDIGCSLLEDAADYQIALLNIESSDILYILQANFPFYIEPTDFRMQSNHLKTDPNAPESDPSKINVGPTSGRMFPVQSQNTPAFIHPSPEPLKASMEKQEQMKATIKELIGCKVDELGNGEGLTYILQCLEKFENDIGRFWNLYVGDKEVNISYPEKFIIQKIKGTQEELNSLGNMRANLPSLRARKEVSKKMAAISLGNHISKETLQEIFKEIDEAKYDTSDTDKIAIDLEQGLVSRALASEARGYPKGQSEIAKEEHIERLTAITIAQTPEGGIAKAGARGVGDLETDPTSGKKEKAISRDNTKEAVPTDKTRGKGK